MAAKILHSLSDENPDLQKQIGCMTGVFQLFDRHQILAGRRIVGHTPKQLPSGSPNFNNGTLSRECSSSSHQRSPAMEKHSNKNAQDKQRLSTESSRASFSSSSRSSSFSSLDYNRTAQPDPLSFDQMIFPETPSRDPNIGQSSVSPQFGRQSFDLRDVVKDSMYREARGLSLKTITREEAPDRVVKHRDSPRPQRPPRNNDGAYNTDLNAKQNLSIDPKDKESLRVLAKLREVPWYLDEPRELSRSKSYQLKDGSSFSVSKDAPRFSYDGRETNRLSFESRDNVKSMLKFKELPRLSLDSRESSMRSLNSDALVSKKNSDSKFSSFPRNPKRDSIVSFDEALVLQKASESQKRPPSVVAKLMGLETLPDSGSTSDGKMGSTRSVEDFNSLSRSSKTTELGGHVKIPNSPRSSARDPTSPRWKNPHAVINPVSRFPIEPAPWKQLDGGRSSQKPASHFTKPPEKAHNPFPSVYGEIDKRLKYLELTSAKDLRALKQILAAMRAKGLLETRNGGQDSHFSSQRDQEEKYLTASENAKMLNPGKPQGDQIISSANTGSNSSRAFESPIVIMKPSRLVGKPGKLDGFSSLPEQQSGDFADNRRILVKSNAAKGQNPRTIRRDHAVNSAEMKTIGRQTRPAQTSTMQQQWSKESTTSSPGKSSGSVSPRLQQKKLELEKRSRPPTPPSDSIKPKKQSNKQQSELNSPGGKRRPKYGNFQQSDYQFNEISGETAKLNLSYHESNVTAQSNNEVVSNSNMDIEIITPERSGEINYRESSSTKATSYSPGLVQKKSTTALTEVESLAEAATSALEYPSPVSVLDDAVYTDDAPSPVKHMQTTLQDDDIPDPSENLTGEQWEPSDEGISNTIGSGLTSEISRKKLQNIDNLVQKLRRLNSGHDEARTDYIASLCENTNPDHRYISEILLASGLLLRNLGSSLTTFQFHSSGHPINPALFLVLEQTKSSNSLKEEGILEKLVQKKHFKEKSHRKLIFDAVNEILAGKLSSVGHSAEPWLRPHKLARKSPNAQKLLRNLCFEIDQIQARRQECSLEKEDDGLKSILWEDVTCRSESWTDFNSEMPMIVLDVERLIFKDLVDEIVMGEASGRRVKPSKRFRQLFVK